MLLSDPNLNVPSLTTLKRIVQNLFQLQYRPNIGAKIKYTDPTYDEKRKWVVRMLAQFHKEGALIVSVDESCFKTFTLPRRAWQICVPKLVR